VKCCNTVTTAALHAQVDQDGYLAQVRIMVVMLKKEAGVELLTNCCGDFPGSLSEHHASDLKGITTLQ